VPIPEQPPRSNSKIPAGAVHIRFTAMPPS
jgi:hypothetical protein